MHARDDMCMHIKQPRIDWLGCVDVRTGNPASGKAMG